MTELADRRPLLGYGHVALGSHQLKIPSGMECGGNSVAFAAVTLDAEVGKETATARRFECDTHFADAGVAAQT